MRCMSSCRSLLPWGMPNTCLPHCATMWCCAHLPAGTSNANACFGAIRCVVTEPIAGGIDLAQRTGCPAARCMTEGGVQVKRVLPGVQVSVFSDRDICGPRRAALEEALASADVFFGSLLFDYDDVEWIKARAARVPLRLSLIHISEPTRPY